ncbi:hypothetical protein KKJ01_14150 [Xenorhabdus bovienii]|uniref:Uncharacterized protein n=1 Tax=Xenorhabdus bovienii TaxID=40576 RepID=A0AAJ1JAT0_XENBV|nr:hypothetical protein [Xenorhabdus bovienii]MDE1479341.1 hypothetical protein [Xenorhabdus bovienii]MDE9522677.1 hypothetical protein [Xenorhabdus bovienii]
MSEKKAPLPRFIATDHMPPKMIRPNPQPSAPQPKAPQPSQGNNGGGK